MGNIFNFMISVDLNKLVGWLLANVDIIIMCYTLNSANFKGDPANKAAHISLRSRLVFSPRQFSHTDYSELYKSKYILNILHTEKRPTGMPSVAVICISFVGAQLMWGCLWSPLLTLFWINIGNTCLQGNRGYIIFIVFIGPAPAS